ncbi:hypothetical protein [Arcticibacterium luteifluviistationis]|uniref:Uncharacterized protein n=1 Tax=Arcticibacterium luteifluviistationis TaxID=1784714 RepID=A0A2Z4G946_9BACT|nr:hypothetical protein [Arcticibacterium luteifluviistationis]AWV97686.1 hypothetical protein DJ013_05705 [Arcticibacterium luteifluviistationis]
MKLIKERNSVSLSRNEAIEVLRRLSLAYTSNLGFSVLQEDLEDPKVFWVKHKAYFWPNFEKITRFKASGISIGSSRQKGSKEDLEAVKEILIEKEITLEYFKKHFIGLSDNSFNLDFLRRILYYPTEKYIQDPYLFLKTEYGFIDDNVLESELSSGLSYLEGYWLSFNRNLEEARVAQCFYHFYIIGNEMKVKREAYSSETIYEGDAYIQEDSSFMFHLKGKNKGRIKFIMANPGKVQPDMLQCLSSAFKTVSPHEPAIVKELLIKLPRPSKLTKGKVLNKAQAFESLALYFQDKQLDKIKTEFNEYLGEDEVPYFTPSDLSTIKKDDLIECKLEAEPLKTIKNQYNYFHFNKLSFNSVEKYHRDIIKYSSDLSSKGYKAFTKNVEFKDEYSLITIDQYSSRRVQTHQVFYETISNNAFVDAQALFPILNKANDDGFQEPSWRESNLSMDAKSDTFVSSATFLNDFSNSKKLQLRFDNITFRSEVVIDFCSIEGFDKMGLFIDEISYLSNLPDEKGGQLLTLELPNKRINGLTIKLDRMGNKLSFEDNLIFDVENTKIFALKMDFAVAEGDYLTIHFNSNSE